MDLITYQNYKKIKEGAMLPCGGLIDMSKDEIKKQHSLQGFLEVKTPKEKNRI